jgi:F420-0:gamma-glutamyl ligase
MVLVEGVELIRVEEAAVLQEKQVGAVVPKVGVDAEESRKTEV